MGFSWDVQWDFHGVSCFFFFFGFFHGFPHGIFHAPGFGFRIGFPWDDFSHGVLTMPKKPMGTINGMIVFEHWPKIISLGWDG